MNSAVDGVSVDAYFVRRDICKFLEGKSNHFSITDPNHNAKNLCYHLIGGSFLIAGIPVIDA